MARASVRQMWKAKLEGTLPAARWPEPVAQQRAPFRGRILGVDPSQELYDAQDRPHRVIPKGDVIHELIV